MGKQKIKLSQSGWIYCFKRGSKFVFLNRKDELIKEFETYKECEEYANNNFHLIDESKTNDIGKCIYCNNKPYKKGATYCNEHMITNDYGLF